MNKSSPSGMENEGLDQALSLARTPAVPAELASRIVARATQLAQPNLEGGSVSPEERHWTSRYGAIAAAFGLVLAIGAGVSIFRPWQTEDLATSDQRLIASAGKPESNLASNNPNAARARPPLDLPAPDQRSDQQADVEDAAGSGYLDRTEMFEEPAHQLAGPAIEISESTEADGEAVLPSEVQMAEQLQRPAGEEVQPAVAAAANSSGPASTSGDVATAGTLDPPAIGPPAPRGLGVAGGASPAPAGPVTRGPRR